MEKHLALTTALLLVVLLVPGLVVRHLVILTMVIVRPIDTVEITLMIQVMGLIYDIVCLRLVTQQQAQLVGAVLLMVEGMMLVVLW